MTYDIQIHIRYTHMLGSFFMSVCLCLLSVHCANHARSRKMFVTLFSFQLLYSNVICHFHASFSGQIGTTDCQEAIKNIICRSLLCGWFNFQFRLFSTFFSVCSHRCSALLFFIFICVELRRRQNRGWSAAYGFGIFVDAIKIKKKFTRTTEQTSEENFKQTCEIHKLNWDLAFVRVLHFAQEESSVSDA